MKYPAYAISFHVKPSCKIKYIDFPRTRGTLLHRLLLFYAQLTGSGLLKRTEIKIIFCFPRLRGAAYPDSQNSQNSGNAVSRDRYIRALPQRAFQMPFLPSLPINILLPQISVRASRFAVGFSAATNAALT